MMSTHQFMYPKVVPIVPAAGASGTAAAGCPFPALVSAFRVREQPRRCACRRAVVQVF